MDRVLANEDEARVAMAILGVYELIESEPVPR